ncbi:MAG: ABC transporter permease [Acidobacteria bacterium]|nr:ABC transporter permease [Acidobacteriota bacterium]
MRRWIGDTWADCVHEWRTTRGLRRVGVVTGSALALLRGLVALVPQPGNPTRNIQQDARFAVRRLRQSPVFSIFAVVTLALSIGAATAVFSLVYAVAYKPPPITDVDEIVNVYSAPGGGAAIIGFSSLDFEDLKARQTSFVHLAGWARFTDAMVLDDGARAFRGEVVDGDYFSVLRVQPHLGLLIQPSDDSMSAPPVVVLSDVFWRSAIGARRDVIGQTVRIGDEPFTIIGVAPPEARGFDTPNLSVPAAWVPIRQRHRLTQSGQRWVLDQNDRNNRWIRGVGRLREGATFEQATAELTQIAQALDAAAPIGTPLDPRFRSRYDTSRQWWAIHITDIRMHESMTRVFGPVVGTVLVSMVLVLLVACTNLANLLLARGASRRQEIAMRMALGASRARLMREQLVECGLLALAGGLLGTLVARGLTILLSTDFSMGDGVQMVISVRPELNLPALALTLCATLIALLIFGVMPAWYSTGGDIRSVLASDASGGVLPRWRGRRVLIGGQVMVSVALLAVTAVSVGNAVRLGYRAPGFALDELALATVEPQLSRVDAASALNSLQAARDRVRQLLGVTGATLASSLPVGAGTGNVSIAPVDQLDRRIGLKSVTVSSDYFTTIGLPVLEGRELSAEDRTHGDRTVVLSARAAEALFERRSVVGQAVTFTRQVYAGEPESPTYIARVVGVVGDAEEAPGARMRWHEGTAYLPLAQHPARALTLIARTAGDADHMAGQLRMAVAGADNRLTITRLKTGEEITDGFTVLLRVVAGTAGVLGAFALLLAVIGLYGVLSFVVARRAREIGVRMALGAERRDVSRLVVADGLTPVVWGLVLGTLLAGPVLLNPLSRQMLSITAASLAFALAAPVVMLLAALVAAWAPARRAARVDPNVALRQQ